MTFFYFKSRAKEPLQEVTTKEPIVPADPTLPDIRKTKWAGILPKTIAENFMTAKTDEERLRWVSDPNGVAEMMSRFFQNEARKSEVFTKLSEISQNLGSQESNARFTANFTDGSKRLVTIKYDENGASKVDFKCYSRYCDTSWDSLLDGSVSKASEMRCILIASDYYNHDFSDESVWLSLLATSPDFEDVIYLYVKRDDPDFAEFLKAPPRVQVRFTVGLESIGTSYQKRQFRMVNPPRTSWISP
jgi:hypothetical protein